MIYNPNVEGHADGNAVVYHQHVHCRLGTIFFVLGSDGKVIKKQLVALSKKYHGNDYKSYDHYLVPFKEMHHSERYRGSMPMKWI